jgi:hypothetical protein
MSDGYGRPLLALDPARLAIATRRRRWPSDAEHREKRVPVSNRNQHQKNAFATAWCFAELKQMLDKTERDCKTALKS